MNSALRSSLRKIRRYNTWVTHGFEAIALAALILIMLITCSDVLGAKLFRTPVPGSLDIVMLAQIVAIAFAASSTLIANMHVAVELFLPYLGKRLKAVVLFAIDLTCLVFFIIAAWRIALYGYELQTSGEVSPTAYIPLYPFAYAIAIAFIPMCIEYVLRLFALFSSDAIESDSRELSS